MDAYERSVRFWLRAYPRRWRAERADELVAVLTDLAPPTAQRVDARTALDLVRGGWTTRARLHPPLAHWLAYRMLGRRIRPAYRDWARDDIEGPWYPLRRVLPGNAPLLFLLALDAASPRVDLWRPQWWLALVAVVIVASVATARAERARALEQHLTLRPGEPVVPGAMVRTLAPRRRLEARSALACTVAALAVLATATTTTVLLAPRGWAAVVEPIAGGVNVETVTAPLGSARAALLGVLAAAATVGLVLGVIGGRRARRALPAAPAQPHRTLAPVPWSTRTAMAAVVGLGLAVAASEAGGTTALWLSPVVGAVALLVLPPAVALLVLARRAAGRPHDVAARGQHDLAARGPRDVSERAWHGPAHGPRDLAARDLWQMAVGGRPSAVEHPVLEPRRVIGPVPAGAVVPFPVHRDPPYPPVPPPPRGAASPYAVADEGRRRPGARH